MRSVKIGIVKYLKQYGQDHEFQVLKIPKKALRMEEQRKKTEISSSHCDLGFEEVRCKWGLADSDPRKSAKQKIK